MKRLDISGQQFGNWTAIKWSSNYKHNKGGYSLWQCKCICGTIKDVALPTLKSGKSTNCGCIRDQNVKFRFANDDFKPGDSFTNITILKRVEDVKSPSGRINKKFQFQCNCGNIGIISKSNLKRNKDVSCKDCSILKGAKKQTNSKTIFHWKTGLEIVCVGSYEIKVVEWLNVNKMDYIWKPKTYQLPSGKRYTPDLFINSINSLVEIKGYWWNSRSYYDEFVSSNQGNIGLWDKKKLKQLKILI